MGKDMGRGEQLSTNVTRSMAWEAGPDAQRAERLGPWSMDVTEQVGKSMDVAE